MTDNKPEPIFVDGAMFSKPREGAPEFIKGSLSVRPESLVPFLRKHTEHLSPKGWYTFDLKQSKNGALYLQLNTWKPEKKDLAMEAVKEARENYNNRNDNYINPEDIPFN